MTIINLDNPAPLDELEWIGTGKVYPTLNPMIAIPQQDHEIFKILNSHRGDVKSAVKVLNGKKKASNDIEMGKLRYCCIMSKSNVVGHQEPCFTEKKLTQCRLCLR
jgi:hypothetical protein